MVDYIRQLPKALWEQIRPIFHKAYPNEAVVAVYGDTFVQLENISPKPMFYFQLRPEDEARILTDKPDLLLHSHPHGKSEASDEDSAQQIATGINWGIVAVVGNAIGDVYSVAYPECWGDGLDILPLVGRSFKWGIRDCWTLARDYYRLEGFQLQNVPRAADPAKYPQGHPQSDPFTYWPPKVGFKPVRPHERKVGDFVVMNLRSSRPNHCAVYLGESRYLTQFTDRYSEEWQVKNEQSLIEQWSFQFYRLPERKRTSK